MISTKHCHFRGDWKLIPPFPSPTVVLAKGVLKAVHVALDGQYESQYPVFPPLSSANLRYGSG